MQKQLWIVSYENMDWCGDIYHCVVQARGRYEAEEIAVPFCNQHMLEEFGDQYEPYELEEHGGDFANIISVERLNEKHEHWKYYQDPTQGEYYPKVNF